MLKIKNILLLFLSLLSILSPLVPIKQKNGVQEVKLDFIKDQENVIGSYKYHYLSLNDDQLIKKKIPSCRMEIYVNDILISNVWYASANISEAKLDFKKELLKEGPNKIIFISIINGNKIYYNVNFTYFKGDNVTIKDFSKTYKGPTLNFLYDGKVEKSFQEEISFFNFYDEIESDFYYRINLDSLQMSLPDIDDTYNAYLSLFVPKGTFKRLTYDDVKGCYDIPLILMQEDDGLYSFTFKKMYFDENTMMMSFSSGDYFKETNSFYLPYKDFDKLNHINSSISINNLGISKFNFEYKFQYSSYLKFVGNCSSSAFCIKTEGAYHD